MTNKKEQTRLLKRRLKRIKKARRYIKEKELVFCLVNPSTFDDLKTLQQLSKSIGVDYLFRFKFIPSPIIKNNINIVGLANKKVLTCYVNMLNLKNKPSSSSVLKIRLRLNYAYCAKRYKAIPLILKDKERFSRSTHKRLVKWIFTGNIKLLVKLQRSKQTKLFKVFTGCVKEIDYFKRGKIVHFVGTTRQELRQIELEKKFKKIKKSRKFKKIQKIEETEGYKKTSALHKMKATLILLALGVFTGSGLGLWYYNNLLRSNIDWESLFERASEYESDYDRVFLTNFSITQDTDKAKFAQIAKSQGKTPKELSPADNFALCEYNANHAESFTVIGYGGVLTMGIKQGIYSDRRYDGNKYEFVNISSGIISVASIDSQVKGANSVSSYKGSNVKANSATWSYDSSMHVSDYINLAGNVPGVIQPYIISSKTIKSASAVEYDASTGNYTFTLELDPMLSVIRYVRQVKKTGGLGSYPTFSSITQKITIDSNWNFVSIDINEKYSAVAYGLPTTCNGSLLNEFKFNEDVTMYT